RRKTSPHEARQTLGANSNTSIGSATLHLTAARKRCSAAHRPALRADQFKKNFLNARKEKCGVCLDRLLLIFLDCQAHFGKNTLDTLQVSRAEKRTNYF